MGGDLPVTFEPLRELVDELFPVHRSPKVVATSRYAR
jgi:hypothetical protein